MLSIETLRQSSLWFRGDLGPKASDDACLAAAKADGGIDYAVWRGDSNGHCYTCNLSGRGNSSKWLVLAGAGEGRVVCHPGPLNRFVHNKLVHAPKLVVEASKRTLELKREKNLVAQYVKANRRWRRPVIRRTVKVKSYT